MKTPGNFLITKEFNHNNLFIEILYNEVVFPQFEQWKKPRAFHMGITWLNIINLNCCVDMDI